MEDSCKVFVEIGSSDFDTLNDLATQGWHGVIVEPITSLIDNIQPRHTNVHYVNKAISDKAGVRTMYTLENYWQSDSDYKGMSRIDTPWNSWPKDAFTEHEVEAITFTDLCNMCNLPCITFLKIDTEGHDLVILNSITDVVWNGRWRPQIIKVEHKHAGAKGIVELLKSKNYKVYKEQFDIYAISL